MKMGKMDGTSREGIHTGSVIVRRIVLVEPSDTLSLLGVGVMSGST